MVVKEKESEAIRRDPRELKTVCIVPFYPGGCVRLFLLLTILLDAEIGEKDNFRSGTILVSDPMPPLDPEMFSTSIFQCNTSL